MKLCLSISCLAAVADAWTYNDFPEWSSEAALCASTVANQSPIDIATANPTVTNDPLAFQGLPDSFTNPELVHELVINNHTWELEWDTEGAAEEKYGVEYNSKIYALKQFHFHSPSEHTLDGQHFDLEAHMVHACLGNISCVTEDPNDENLVVAIFMNVGEQNSFLQSMWPALAALAANSSAPSRIDRVANPYNGLVPPQPHDFYRYIGSTTTPSCVEGVEWFLMSTPVTLSQEQLTTYRQAISTHAFTQTLTTAEAPVGVSEGWDVTLGTNNRPIQDTGNRIPEKYTQPAEVAAEQRSFMWHGVLIGVLCVALGLCCLLAFMMATKPKEKKKAATRAIKPKKEAPEQVPLVAPPPPAPVPMLFTQPLQVPVNTFAYPGPQMHAGPQMMAGSQMHAAPQMRPLMMSP